MRARRVWLIVLTASIVAMLAAPVGAAGGDLDPAFGGDGLVEVGWGVSARGEAIAMTSDGRIVVAASVERPPPQIDQLMAVLRYQRGGGLDRTFSGDGKAVAFAGAEVAVADVAVQRDDKIVVAGTWYAQDCDDTLFAVARLRTNGGLDPTFSSDGKVTTRFAECGSSGFYVNVWALALQPDGKILLVGSRSGRLAIVRYRSDGSLDLSFGGGDGKAEFSGLLGGALVEGWDIAVRPDGRIMVVGETGSDMLLMRLLTNGAPDDSFGADGVVLVGSTKGYRVALRPDGKMVVAGTEDATPFVARFLAGGQLDTTFGVGGYRALTGRTWIPTGLVLQPDGKIVTVGGRSAPGADPYSVNPFEVVRVRAQGSLDGTFGVNGVVALPSHRRAAGVALQSDGRIVVAGGNLGYRKVVVARFLPA